MDPAVIDSPWLVRALVVNAFILPFRPRRSAAAYRSIWQPNGSPLLVHSRALRDSVAKRIDMPVALAMRYGEPSIERALQELLDLDVDEILLLPLYPQHAASTRTTTIVRTRELIGRMAPRVSLRVLPPFYDDADYQRVLAESIASAIPDNFDLLLFSFHGLPERHVTREDPTGNHCLRRDDCCEVPSPAHASCYRHHCRTTARTVAAQLSLDGSRWHVSFQSRLGRLPWLAPYTDRVLADLPRRGIRRLAIACPAFVADNLETLEEVDIAGREIFMAAGGESLSVVPCLNANEDWVQLVSKWCVHPLPEAAIDTHA